VKLFSVTAVVLFLAIPAHATAPGEPHVASCERGPVMIGSGSPAWRAESLAAGPVGVRRRPLRGMGRWGPRKPGHLVTKMPLLVEGHDPVTVSVPPRLRHRVFLYYGTHEGRNGGRSTSFAGYPGDSSIEFRPCAKKARTIWPGGIRVKGRKPVRLFVEVEGGPARAVLPLGRPQLYKPS
jgi:hypothetical protein